MKKVLLIGVLTVIVLAGAAWFAMRNLPVQLSEGPAELLTFTSPRNATLDATVPVPITWKLKDRSLLKKYPAEDTFISFTLMTLDGKVIGALGDGEHINESSFEWRIWSYLNQGSYAGLKAGETYKIQAKLAYQPRNFECDPAVRGECAPMYSVADQELITNEKRYTSESIPFSIDLNKYVRPQGTIDISSLTVSATSTALTGTANVPGIRIYVRYPFGHADSNQELVNTNIPVVNGAWSFVPELPNGQYLLTLWTTDGYSSLETQDFTIAR